MPKGKSASHQALLEAKLSELTALIKEFSPDARVEIVAERHEDEDAAVDVYVPQAFQAAAISDLERALGERCNDILLDTGLFIIGAVRD
jgi:hypothetical protein